MLKIRIDPNKLGSAVNEFLDEVIDEIFQRSQENIVNKKIIDEGTLLKVGRVGGVNNVRTITYPLPYAESIEFGRTPGTMPPVSAIQGWVTRKLGIRDPKRANSIAWAISQNIKKHGQEPRPFLRPAIDSVKERLK